MGVRCSDCSRLFDGVGGLEGHECDGDNVTILVIHPQAATDAGENPARVFESRSEAEEVREELGVPTRIIDAPLIEAGEEATDGDE